MPFNLLSAFAALTGATPTGVATLLPVLDAPDVALTDAAGGTLVSPVDGALGALVYTALDGSETTSTVDIADDFILAPQTGVPIGNAGQFAFVMTDEFVNTSGEAAGETLGLFVATVGDDGTIGVTNSVFDAFTSDTFAGFASLELIAMSDGRIGYVYDRLEENGETTIGVLSSDGVGQLTVSPFATFDSGLTAHMIALEDGGTLVFTQAAGEAADQFTIWQFGPDNALLETQPFDPSAFEALGVDADAGIVAGLDINGDLQLTIVDASGDTVEAFAQTLDLLPVTEIPVIEPPLPPIDEPVADVVATDGDDILSLTSGDDVFDALGGNDTIKGLGGKDWIIGGDGDDSIDGGRGDDALIAGEPVEPVDGDVAGDALPPQGGLYGGAGDDSINGRMGTDYIDGGDGNDDLRGGLGGDSATADGAQGVGGLFGGEGDDFMRGNRGADDMFGGTGNDDMNGGFGDDIIYGDDGNDKVSGFDGADLMYGGDGDDVMHGGRGNDVMFGGAGDDVLRGAEGGDQLWATGGGNDLLIGGDGADAFGASGDAGTATVKDFNVGQDVIASDAGLAFEDIFLSQEDSVAVIQIGDTTMRLNNVNVDDLSEDDFLLL